MKQAVKVAWSLGVPALLAVLLFFFLVVPARAPSGGKLWTGGRTIASLQEQDFDRRLLKLQICYGVRVQASQCTLERRRVCKAMVVHELESALDAQGKYLRAPLQFQCEDTALTKSRDSSQDLVSLRPNAEISSIQAALKTGLSQAAVNLVLHQEAREACEFLTECKWAMRPQSLSLRRIGSCLSTANATHRKVLLDEVGAMLFGGKGERRNTLYPQLVEDTLN